MAQCDTICVFKNTQKTPWKWGGEKQWKKNLDQFLTLDLDQFLTLETPNLGPVFNSTAHIYIYTHQKIARNSNCIYPVWVVQSLEIPGIPEILQSVDNKEEHDHCLEILENLQISLNSRDSSRWRHPFVASLLCSRHTTIMKRHKLSCSNYSLRDILQQKPLWEEPLLERFDQRKVRAQRLCVCFAHLLMVKKFMHACPAWPDQTWLKLTKSDQSRSLKNYQYQYWRAELTRKFSASTGNNFWENSGKWLPVLVFTAIAPPTRQHQYPKDPSVLKTVRTANSRRREKTLRQ